MWPVASKCRSHYDLVCWMTNVISCESIKWQFQCKRTTATANEPDPFHDFQNGRFVSHCALQLIPYWPYSADWNKSLRDTMNNWKYCCSMSTISSLTWLWFRIWLKFKLHSDPEVRGYMYITCITLNDCIMHLFKSILFVTHLFHIYMEWFNKKNNSKQNINLRVKSISASLFYTL